MVTMLRIITHPRCCMPVTLTGMATKTCEIRRDQILMTKWLQELRYRRINIDTNFNIDKSRWAIQEWILQQVDVNPDEDNKRIPPLCSECQKLALCQEIVTLLFIWQNKLYCWSIDYPFLMHIVKERLGSAHDQGTNLMGAKIGLIWKVWVPNFTIFCEWTVENP